MRVNIEEEAWKRLYEIAYDKKISIREVAGTLACLWSKSQDRVKTHGTREEIAKWASLTDLPEDKIDLWITFLEDQNFLSCGKDGLYKIHGNKEQLETAATYSKRASKGGKALRKKMKELRVLKAGLKQTTSNLLEAPRGSSQVKSSHYKSLHFNSSSPLVENLKTSPLFKFLDGFESEAVLVDSNVIRTVFTKISEGWPRPSRSALAQALKENVADLTWSWNGFKWLLLAVENYKAYCLKNNVQKVYGLNTFLQEWINWIPEQRMPGEEEC